MAEFTNDLLKQAIADAERVRETAIANAKIQLEESITPTIKQEIANALKQVDEVDEAHDPHKGQDAHGYAKVGESVEAESEEVVSEAEEEVSEEVVTEAEETEEEVSEEVVAEGDEDEEGEAVVSEDDEITEEMEDEEDEEEEEEEEQDEGVLDLEAILRELQAEVDAMNEEEDDEEEEEEEDSDLDMGEDDDDDQRIADLDLDEEDRDEEEEDEEEVEEDLDIDAILREIEAELSEEDDSTVAEENARLQSELAEYQKAVELLRSKLNEVNLLNAKLLFTNKLFKSRELTQEQKVHVIETFDLATTLREVKLLYATLSEATIPVKSKKSTVPAQTVVTEAIASNVVGSTAPKTEVIEEDAMSGFRRRMQELAGVKVL
jgi:hypothetical protein